VGWVRSGATSTVEARFADGARAAIPVTWVSAPINAGFVAYPVPRSHWKRAHALTSVAALDADGRVIDMSLFLLPPPPRPTPPPLKQLTGRWDRINWGVVMVVGPRGKVAVHNSGAGWYYAKFSRVTAHRLSISGVPSCSGTGTYRWTITAKFSGWSLNLKKIHDACKPRVNLFAHDDWGGNPSWPPRS
jgi:hypothetical protein